MSTPRTPPEFVRQTKPIKVGEVGARWKVTASYTVRLDAKGTEMKCVRLRFGIGPVMHFSQAEFDRLFKEDPDPFGKDTR